jgi:hypothetical protein
MLLTSVTPNHFPVSYQCYLRNPIMAAFVLLVSWV